MAVPAMFSDGCNQAVEVLHLAALQSTDHVASPKAPIFVNCSHGTEGCMTLPDFEGA